MGCEHAVAAFDRRRICLLQLPGDGEIERRAIARDSGREHRVGQRHGHVAT